MAFCGDESDLHRGRRIMMKPVPMAVVLLMTQSRRGRHCQQLLRALAFPPTGE
jgi:hypothetical protein